MGRHIVVCGLPRSGTTLLYLMLMNTVENFVFYNREISVLNTYKWARFQCTKCPMDVSRLATVYRNFSDIHPILCMRDPRSVMCSVHANSEGRYKMNWDSRLVTGNDGVYGISQGEGTKYFLDLIIQVQKQFSDVQTTVFYENLISDPDSVQADIEDRMGLPMKYRFSSWNNEAMRAVPAKLTYQLNGVRSIDKTRIKSWREYPERMKQIINDCGDELQEYLEIFGYEKDAEWMKQFV